MYVLGELTCGQKTPPYPELEPDTHSLIFIVPSEVSVTCLFLQGKVVSPVPNPQPGGPWCCFVWPLSCRSIQLSRTCQEQKTPAGIALGVAGEDCGDSNRSCKKEHCILIINDHLRLLRQTLSFLLYLCCSTKVCRICEASHCCYMSKRESNLLFQKR